MNEHKKYLFSWSKYNEINRKQKKEYALCPAEVRKNFTPDLIRSRAKVPENKAEIQKLNGHE